MSKQKLCCAECGCLNPGECAEEIATLKAVLKRLEWSGPTYEEGGIRHGHQCPACYKHQYTYRDPGHAPDCYLAAALQNRRTQ